MKNIFLKKTNTNTGIIRRIDDLGRIIIPRELRKKMKLEEGDPLEIYYDDDKKIIGFKKYIE